MMTRNEQIASIMLEAAELLKESAGANGAYRRYVEESHKSEKARNDKYERDNAKRKAAYERAGYGDIAATKFAANRSHEKDLGEDVRDMRRKKRAGQANRDNARLSKNWVQGKDDALEYYNRSVAERADKERNRSQAVRDERARKNARINRRAALKEAVDLLYEQALLCESAEEAEGYITKAEELQKDIDRIPEERPVSMNAYPTSVNGGSDRAAELEEIRDLCDGDREVMDLLTDDENKSVTIDA